MMGSEDVPGGYVAVAAFGTREEARHAVDDLARRGLPVRGLTVVGSGLEQVRRLKARSRYRRLFLLGAAVGLGAGSTGKALFAYASGSLLPVGILLWAAVWSTAAGVVLGALMPSSERPAKRVVVAGGDLAPRRFELYVSQEMADRARVLLAARPERARR